MKRLKVDIVSDIICPWCFIGARRLQQVLDEQQDMSVELMFHPFQLDPTTPDEGSDLRERLRRKYDVEPARVFERVEAAARESGIPLDFGKISRTPNTLRGHTLLGAASAKGTQAALADALFDGYFLRGLDIGQTDVLAELASQHGFDAEEARALVCDDGALLATRAEARALSAGGISGVPYFVLNERLAFSGAQPTEVFRRAIAQALEGP